MRRTAGSRQASRKARQPRRSSSTGSLPSPATAATCSTSPASSSSTTARNSPSLVPKWWYSAPRLTPAAAATCSRPVPANPRTANCSRAASSRARLVADVRSACVRRGGTGREVYGARPRPFGRVLGRTAAKDTPKRRTNAGSPGGEGPRRQPGEAELVGRREDLAPEALGCRPAAEPVQQAGVVQSGEGGPGRG